MNSKGIYAVKVVRRRWLYCADYFLAYAVPRLRLQGTTARLRRQAALLTSADKLQLGLFAGFSASCFLRVLPSVETLLIAGIFVLILSWRFTPCRGAIMGVFFALCFAIVQFDRFTQQSLPVDFESKSLYVEGVVVGLPQNSETRQRFDFRIRTVAPVMGNEFTPSEKSALSRVEGQLFRLSCYRCTINFAAEQIWTLTVRVKRPHGYASWGAFDYERYLFRQKVVALGYVREKEPFEYVGDTAPGIHGWRSRVRDQLEDLFQQPSAGGGIIAALTLGDKSQLSRMHKDIFQSVGVSHLMAISGLHVGLVFVSSLFFLQCLLWPVVRLFNYVARQTIVLIPGLIAASAYAALSGFAVSTQRALIMLSVYVLCRLLARDLSLLRVLLLAAVIILCYDPFSILDAGFWLSCCAVFIIALLNLRQRNLSLWKLQPALWMGMLPLSAALFGQVSLVSPLINLVAVPIFCLLLIPLTLCALLMHQLGAATFALQALAILKEVFTLIFQVFAWCADLPLALIYPSAVELWQWVLLSLVILLSLLRPRVSFIAFFFIGLWVWPSREPIPQDAVTMTVLDVGQGLSIVIEVTDYVLVYDTGPAYGTGFSAAEAVLVPYLRARGVQQVDQLVISHADNDHIGGLDYLRSHIEIKSTLTSRPDRIPGAHYCAAGQSWYVGNIKFDVLGPDSQTPAGSNNRSCVLAIENSQYRILITGDIERGVERHMLQTSPGSLRSDFLLVPHQGSKTSSTAEFLDAVQPQLAFIAAGYKNHYGHPHADVITRYQQRDIELASTINHGSIQLKIEGESWSWIAYRKEVPRFWR